MPTCATGLPGLAPFRLWQNWLRRRLLNSVWDNLALPQVIEKIQREDILLSWGYPYKWFYVGIGLSAEYFHPGDLIQDDENLALLRLVWQAPQPGAKAVIELSVENQAIFIQDTRVFVQPMEKHRAPFHRERPDAEIHICDHAVHAYCHHSLGINLQRVDFAYSP